MIITPSNELDAVNEILSSVGSSPVNSLEDDLNVDVLNAQRILKATSIEIQSRGYKFNTLNNVYLQPDSDTGLVPYARNYIRVFSTGYKLVDRSGYFFDLETDTNEFPNGLTITELVKELPFEELPVVFRKYITVRAARVFQMRYLTSGDIDNHLQIEESSAYADIVDYELMTGNYNVFNDDQYISQQIQRS
mgnify:CR=1 FL=1